MNKTKTGKPGIRHYVLLAAFYLFVAGAWGHWIYKHSNYNSQSNKAEGFVEGIAWPVSILIHAGEGVTERL